MWHMTRDMWHVTHDMWQVTHDMWHVTGWGRWTFTQNFSSLALMVWEWKCTEDISTNHQSLSDLISNGGVYRTAPATPGLLISPNPEWQRSQMQWQPLGISVWNYEHYLFGDLQIRGVQCVGAHKKKHIYLPPPTPFLMCPLNEMIFKMEVRHHWRYLF